MPTLAEVFQLANRSKANRVQFNIETKLDPTVPKGTVAPATFARKVVDTIKRYKLTKRGGRRYRPENTLPAFQYGLSRDVDTLELDTA